MNKDLYGKYYDIPKHILTNLNNFSSNESIGHLLNGKKVSYSQLKKLKHRMENGEMNELGGETFYNWTNQTLNSDRESLKTMKQARTDAGMENQFISTHQKNKNISSTNRSTQDHNKENSDIKITEALRRINQIMQKII